tara:strand:- start:21096 stop:22703 length:1608 start_codon:yes stop_codon:yes gene_type:complete
MADTSTFQAIGVMPNIDYGAAYNNAKARREAEEQRKLDYLASFQQERGAFTPGMQEKLQEEWDAIEADLDAGDMSFDAKARRQRMYNQYKEHAANAIEYATQLNDLEASVMANPEAYNDPQSILEDLGTARDIEVSTGLIPAAIAELPNINEFKRYSLAEMSPNSTAGLLLDRLKKSGGISKFYDMARTGNLQPAAVSDLVSSYFRSNQLSQEEMDQAIAFAMRQKGVLGNSVEDLKSLRNLSQEDRDMYLAEYATFVNDSLTNLLAEDVQTEAEKLRNEIAKRASVASASASSKQNKGTFFFDSRKNLTYDPPYVLNERGAIDPKVEYSSKVSDAVLVGDIEGTNPTYRDPKTGRNYTIENLLIDPNGSRKVLVSFTQEIEGDDNKRVFEELSYGRGDEYEIPMDGLSNAKQAAMIDATFDSMRSYYDEKIQPGLNVVNRKVATAVVGGIPSELDVIEGEGTPPSELSKEEMSARERRRLEIETADTPEERQKIILRQLSEDIPEDEKEELREMDMSDIPVFDAKAAGMRNIQN